MSVEHVKYSPEQIRSAIHIDDSVIKELTELIEDHLNKCGIYHRIFSRIKSPDSLSHKYELKEYTNADPCEGENPDDFKKIQDLIGIRVNLYYEDDLEFCQTILNRCFDEDNWSASETTVSEFQAAKINGVFHIPDNLVDEISPETWNMAIDKTFEVQLKTVMFDAWHEVEHDMRYKNAHLWQSHMDASRQMNSILATLELCDKSMVNLLEDLAHDLYKEECWVEMLRLHFRVKMHDAPLYEGISEILGRDNRAIGKLLYKYKRNRFLNLLLKRPTPLFITPNSIIEVIGEDLLSDEAFSSKPENESKIASINELLSIMKSNRTYTKPSYDASSYTLLPLTEKITFQGKGVLGTRRENIQKKDIFSEAVVIIHKWAVNKYHGVLPNLPPCINDENPLINMREDGYSIKEVLYSEELYFDIFTSHLDMSTPGRIWFTHAKVFDKDQKIHLEVVNYYKDTKPMSRYNQLKYFSYPGFYRDLCDNLGVYDGRTCQQTLHQISTTEKKDAFLDFAKDKNRYYPIVLFVLDEKNKDGMIRLDDTQLDKHNHWISRFIKIIWRSAHIFGITTNTDEEILHAVLENARPTYDAPKSDDVRGIYLIPPIKDEVGYSPIFFSMDDIINCKYDWMIGPDQNDRLHNILVGPNAFRQKLLDDIKLIVVEPK